MRHHHRLLLAIALGSAAGCESKPAPRAATQSPAQQGEPLSPSTPLAERPMAQRREAQLLIDSAGTLLTQRDTADAARLLHRAAAFFLVQAYAPPSGGSDDLLDAARALDSLAGDLRRHYPVDSGRLARISAHANFAEAERHGALATVAWSTRSKQSVSDELAMAADHVERGVRDAAIPMGPALRQVLVEMRSIASQLSSRHDLDVQVLDEPLAALHVEVRALHRKLTAADRASEHRDGGAS